MAVNDWTELRRMGERVRARVASEPLRPVSILGQVDEARALASRAQWLHRDYTRPGQVVLDTHAGWGTTLLAAMLEGRRAIGAEVDEDAWQDARERCLPYVERCAAMVGVPSGRTLDLF